MQPAAAMLDIFPQHQLCSSKLDSGSQPFLILFLILLLILFLFLFLNLSEIFLTVTLMNHLNQETHANNTNNTSQLSTPNSTVLCWTPCSLYSSTTTSCCQKFFFIQFVGFVPCGKNGNSLSLILHQTFSVTCLSFFWFVLNIGPNN